MRETNRPARAGFTLIELLVVIGIIVLLVSILIPVVSKMRDKAQVTSVAAQMNSIESAIQAYSMANGGALPGPIPNGLVGANPPAFTINVKGGGSIALLTGSPDEVLAMLKPLGKAAAA